MFLSISNFIACNHRYLETKNSNRILLPGSELTKELFQFQKIYDARVTKNEKFNILSNLHKNVYVDFKEVIRSDLLLKDLKL